MKKSICFVLLVLSLLAINGSVRGQDFPYHLYDTRTISEMIEMNMEEAKKMKAGDNKKLMISASPFYSAIRLQYAGKSRNLSQEKIGLFKIWQESLGVDPRLSSLLDKEFLFKECGKEYWIPVQKPAAQDFPTDLKDGDRITLYLMMVGGIEDKGNWDFVFFTNSFKIYR